MLGTVSNSNKGKKVVHLGTIVDDEFPTWHRKKQDAGEGETVPSDKTAVQFSREDEDDKFDIPTFLRKQMD